MMLQVLQRPMQFVQRPLPSFTGLEIYWWRLVCRSMRLLNWGKQRTLPVVLPVQRYLWVPAAALVFGVILGWAISAG